MKTKFAWIITPEGSWEHKKEMITTSLEAGINHVLDLDENKKIKKLANVNIISNNEDGDICLIGVNSEGDGTLPLAKTSKDLNIAKEAKKQGKTICAYVEILDKAHENLAVEIGKVADYIILVGKDWTVIPLENIIASLQNEKVKIIAAVNNVNEAKLAIETLEIGTDGIIFKADNINIIKEIANLIDLSSNEFYDLKEAVITDIKLLGSGDRVCIDTTTMMSPGEGMLVGSYSKALFLVHSESLESEYVASRPFRVNAGPVQAYIMVPGNKTRYLSEILTGDEVLIVNSKGETRSAVVGRSKIERRPLILVEAEIEDFKFKTILQNAETIRLVNNNNQGVSISDLKIGDFVKVFIEKNARHFGISVNETIIEQ